MAFSDLQESPSDLGEDLGDEADGGDAGLPPPTTATVTLESTNAAWLDTGVVLPVGQRLTISADGTVQWGAFEEDTSGPAGLPYDAGRSGNYAAGPLNTVCAYGLAVLLLPDDIAPPDVVVSAEGAAPATYDPAPAGGLYLGPGAYASYSWDELMAMLPASPGSPGFVPDAGSGLGDDASDLQGDGAPVPQSPMRVFVIFNDNVFSDNQGSYQVTIGTRPDCNPPPPIVNFLVVPVLNGNVPSFVISGI